MILNLLAFSENRHWFFDLAETLDFVSQPILVILAILGLRQLWLSRTIARITVDREARRLAIEKTIEYAEDILPIVEQFKVEYAADKFPYLKELLKEVQIAFNSDGALWKLHVQDIPKLLKEGGNEDRLLLRVCNKLEGFSMWFMNGAANIEIAEKPIRHSFCLQINLLLPFLIVNNHVSKKTQYSNTLQLYRHWVTEDIVKQTQKEIEEREKLAEIVSCPPPQPHGFEELGGPQKKTPRRAKSKKTRR